MGLELWTFQFWWQHLNPLGHSHFDLSEKSSTFFEDAVRSLSVKPDKYYVSDMENLSYPVEIAIRKFENHPNVQAIKQDI